MKKFLLILIFSLFLVSCAPDNSKISKDEAVNLVIEKRSTRIHDVDITYIKKEGTSFIIEWENPYNVTKEIDKVTSSGEIIAVEEPHTSVNFNKKSQ